MSAYDRAYYIKNKERILAAAKIYRANNKEMIAARTKIYSEGWRARNAEKIRIQHKRYYIENKERILDQQWRHKNRLWLEQPTSKPMNANLALRDRNFRLGIPSGKKNYLLEAST